MEHVWRQEAPHVLAALLRRNSDFAACEDAVQEALLAASDQWPDGGTPDNPRGWLIRVASRRLIDEHRSTEARARREERFAQLQTASAAPAVDAVAPVDDTLQIMLLCAQPALTSTSSVALTLRAVAGLTTRQIAAGFLVPESTIARRISRAKAAIRDSGSVLVAPSAADLPSRMHSVRHTLYLTFTVGHTMNEGTRLVDVDLAEEAIRLTEMLHRSTTHDPETTGLLALMLLSHARTGARIDDRGDLVPLEEQDRGRWDRRLIERGVDLVERALPDGAVGPFQLQATIAAVHAEAPTPEDTDWLQIVVLYRMLTRLDPSPTVRLNLAAAVGMAHGAQAGLAALEPLIGDVSLRRSHRVHAVRAHLLERAGDIDEARQAYRVAAGLTASIPEQRYLNRKAAG